MKHPLAACFLLLPWIPACQFHASPAVWVESSVQSSFAAADVARLRCTTHNGAIRIREDRTATTVEVTANIRAGGADDEDARRALAAIEVRCATDGGELRADWEWRERRDGWGATVAFEVVVPRSVPVHVETHNGAVVATAADRATVTTHNGGIEVAGALRELAIETHNGDVRVRCTQGGPVGGSVTTHNGSAVVELADGVDAEVRCSTHNGAIHIEGPTTTRSAGDGHAAATFGAGADTVRVTTHNGRVVVRQPG